MRILSALPVLCALCAPACSTLSSEDEQQLASHQRNAALYWEGNRLGQAERQVERGLEIEPDDYKLLSLQAAIHLRQSLPPSSPDQRKLDQSLAGFENLWKMRSPSRHDQRVLFFYALARQKQGMRMLNEAEQLRIGGGLPPREPDPKAAKARVAQADAEFEAARGMLEELLDRGALQRLCHYHLMQLDMATGNPASALAHGDEYLGAVAKEQQAARENIATTTIYDWEVEQKQTLAALQREEIDVRTFMAQQLHAERKYEEALPHLDAILALDPSRTKDYYNRGIILRELGRTEAAKSDLRTFVATSRLPPDNPQIVDAVKTLRSQ